MSVSVERVGNRIHLTSDTAIRGLGNHIPGASFSDRGGHARWSLPLSVPTCTLLRKRYPDAAIGPELAAWYRLEAGRERNAKKLRKAKKAKLPRVKELAPALHKAVKKGRPYQSVGARWISDGKAVLIGDDVGLGKTIQLLAGVLESGVPGPYLIICPKTAVEPVWAAEIRDWLPGHEVVTIPDGRSKRDSILNDLMERNDLDKTWVIVHPEAVRTKSYWVCRKCRSRTLLTHKPKVLDCGHDKDKTTTHHDHTFPQLFHIGWGAVGVDESDRALIRITGTPTMVRRGMELLRDLRRPDCLLIAQSATPFRSRPKLFWSTLNWLRPKEFTSFWNWVGTYFEMTDNLHGGKVIGNLRADREEMLWRSLDGILLRRTREEVLKHLPPKLYIGRRLVKGGPVAVWLPMTPEQARMHQQMTDDGEAELVGGHITAIGTLAEYTRLKQFATSTGQLVGREFVPTLPSNKFNYLVQMLEELGYPEDPQTKVVIVSQFTSVLNLFEAELERVLGAGTTVMLTGSVSGDRRNAAIRAFNRVGHAPYIMLLNTKAGGAAITLDAADEMVFLDSTAVPDDQAQAEGRINNRRPEEKVAQRRYRYLMSLDSIEETIAAVGEERAVTSHKILDGRRGVTRRREVKKK